MYIRFAHEMNGYWFSWNVNKNNYQDFMTSWKRYRALQQEIFPQAQLVFSVNKESNGADMDWTKFFPGKQYVDVLSVDYYNNWPYASTLSQFQQQSWEKRRLRRAEGHQRPPRLRQEPGPAAGGLGVVRQRRRR